ncbi:MAG TPA: hypothetical protein VF746_28225 [Longimicrobium sp.]
MPAARHPAKSARSRPKERPRPAPAPAGPGWAPRPWQVALALGVLHVLLTLMALNPAPHLGGDNAAYLALARSLLEGRGYVELWDPALRPHTQFPPGFPAILAVAMLLGVKPWVGFKVLVAAFSGVAVALSYAWARRVSGPGVALGAGLLLAVGPGVIDQSQLELSDVPFWVFTMLALWAFARWSAAAGEPAASPAAAARPGAAAVAADDARPAPAWSALKWVALAAVATLLALFTRSAGLPLVVAAAGWLALRRRWRELALFLAVVLPFAVAWAVRQRLAAGGGAYVTQFWLKDPYRPDLGTIGVGGLFARVGENALKYVDWHLPSLLAGLPEHPVLIAAAAALVLLAVAGWARRLRRPGVAELFVPLYLGLILVWPEEWADSRFLLPALPLMLVYAGEALGLAGERLGRRRLVGAGAAALLVLAAVPGFAKQVRRAEECRAEYAAGNHFSCHAPVFGTIFVVAEQVRGRLPEGSVVLSRKPSLFWAISGYPSRLYPFDAGADGFFAAAAAARARYIVFDQTQEFTRFMRPVVLARRDQFCLMPEIGTEMAVLARIGPNPPFPPGTAPDVFRICDAPVPPDETAPAPAR